MYDDRLREMTYISPQGNEFTLSFDGVERSGGKKAPVSEYPGQNQAGVQDLGEVTPTFQVTCYIAGSDYDSEADRFWYALEETGPGKLIHPRWGNINVLPTNKTQVEEFVDGAGRAVFTITFIRANIDSFEYPQVSSDFESTVSSNVDDAVTEIEDNAPEEITNVAIKTGTENSILDTLDSIIEGFDSITEMTDDVRNSITETVNDITKEIDALVSAPASLMTSMLKLYRLPSTMATDIKEKVLGYSTIYSSLADGYVETTKKYGEDFGLIAVGNISGLAVSSAESVSVGNIQTRDEAGEIIDDISNLYSNIKTTMLELESAGSFQIPYSLWQGISNAMSSAILGLIKEALDLPAERSIILERAVDPITLYWELFGNIDNLDSFMEYNNFVGDEILLIPRGREVRYYVQ